MINFHSVQSFQTGYEKRTRQYSDAARQMALGCALFQNPRAGSKTYRIGQGSGQRRQSQNSKNISAGDIIDLTLNSLPYKIKVLALNHQRRPAPEARQLYEEDMKTAAEREAQKQLDQASRISAAYPDGRPTKRDRRQLDRMKRDSW